MFKELFTESNEDFCQNLDKEYKKYFPMGFFSCKKQKALSGDIYNFYFGLIGNPSDVPNKIRQNDPMWHQFLIFIDKNDSNKLELSPSVGGISIKPEEGSYKAMDRVKTKLRKTKGDHTKIEKYLKGWFKKLHGLMKDQKDNVYGDFPSKYLNI